MFVYGYRKESMNLILKVMVKLELIFEYIFLTVQWLNLRKSVLLNQYKKNIRHQTLGLQKQFIFISKERKKSD